MLRKQLYSLRLLIDKISLRERYLMLVTLVALVLLIAQGTLMVTGLDKHDGVNTRIENTERQIRQIEQALVDYRAAINNPRVQSLQQSNLDIQERISNLEDRISEINDTLMSPNQMVSLLKELLENQKDLTVERFTVLPVQTVESNLDGGNLFYQHGLSMELTGSYEALTAYLSEIESLEHQLFWDDLTIETDNFPSLTIKLKVHTLSQDEEWLNV